MEQDAARLVAHLEAQVADLEAQVDVLIAVPVARVEALDFLEQAPADEQARAGHGLEIARPVDVRKLRVAVREQVIRRDAALLGVAHDGDAAVLQRAVRIQQPRAHDAHVGLALQDLDQRIEPSR